LAPSYYKRACSGPMLAFSDVKLSLPNFAHVHLTAPSPRSPFHSPLSTPTPTPLTNITTQALFLLFPTSFFPFPPFSTSRSASSSLAFSVNRLTLFPPPSPPSTSTSPLPTSTSPRLAASTSRFLPAIGAAGGMIGGSFFPKPGYLCCQPLKLRVLSSRAPAGFAWRWRWWEDRRWSCSTSRTSAVASRASFWCWGVPTGVYESARL